MHLITRIIHDMLLSQYHHTLLLLMVAFYNLISSFCIIFRNFNNINLPFLNLNKEDDSNIH